MPGLRRAPSGAQACPPPASVSPRSQPRPEAGTPGSWCGDGSGSDPDTPPTTTSGRLSSWPRALRFTARGSHCPEVRGHPASPLGLSSQTSRPGCPPPLGPAGGCSVRPESAPRSVHLSAHLLGVCPSLHAPLSICLPSPWVSWSEVRPLPASARAGPSPMGLPPAPRPWLSLVPEAPPAFLWVANKPEPSSWEGSTLNLTSLPPACAARAAASGLRSRRHPCRCARSPEPPGGHRPCPLRPGRGPATGLPLSAATGQDPACL